MPNLGSSTPARNIAVILNLNKDFDRKIAKGISKFAKEARNWTIYLEDDFANRIPSFQQLHASGVIANLDDREISEPLAALNVPVVGVGGAASQRGVALDVSYVGTDNQKIAKIAAEHLIERGLKHFAYCGIPAKEGDPRTAWSLAREVAFAETLRTYSRECAVFRSSFHRPNQWDEMQKELSRWLIGLTKPVGVMACDDPKARHVLVACRNLGLLVPDEVAVVGVDNDPLMCQMISPELTSVSQNAERIGYLAAEALERSMSGLESEPIRLVPPTGLVIRQSSDGTYIEDPVVADCLRLIRDRIECNVKAPEVAKHSGYSREMLDLRFRRAVELTVSGMIQKAKLERAQELLLTTSYSLRAIADRLGFSSEQYLVKWFHQLTGELPGAFRSSRGK